MSGSSPFVRARELLVPGCRLLVVNLLILSVLQVKSQPADTISSGNSTRCIRNTSIAVGGGMVGTLLLLDRAWYAGYDRSPLHGFNDGTEWLQMDKAGHLFSAYTLGGWGHRLFDRCGMGEGWSLWVGGSMGLVFLSGVEVLDGTSAAWGFSGWDMVANIAGTGTYIAQHRLWKEQRATLKLSARPTGYAVQRPDLLGEGLPERILKDYNGQTIWLSGNLRSLTRSERLPQWLNLAVGLGAEGMITAEEMPGDGRYRQYYLSPDVDLTRIRTRSSFLRTVLVVLNGIKFPAPALEIRSTGKVVGHWVYF